MDFRNPVFNAYGTIDCEINHPDFGWVPITVSPADGSTKDIYAAIIAGGGIASYVAPPPPNLSAIDTATLNAALVEPGSVVRALGLVMFAEVNKLRVKTGDPVYTMAQFTTALKAQMR
jgi:hypothetical protein